MSKKSLNDMNAGQSGKVIIVDGGHGFMRKLEAMGIRPGVEITKISGQIMRGPVIVKIGATQVAIGYGMASRVIVEI